jgi:hypothetical protein
MIYDLVFMNPPRASVHSLLNFSVLLGLCFTRLKEIAINCPCSNKTTNAEITGRYNKMRTNNSDVTGELWETWSDKYKNYHKFLFVLECNFHAKSHFLLRLKKTLEEQSLYMISGFCLDLDGMWALL